MSKKAFEDTIMSNATGSEDTTVRTATGFENTDRGRDCTNKN